MPLANRQTRAHPPPQLAIQAGNQGFSARRASRFGARCRTCPWVVRKAVSVQRTIEMLIGRLITDEDFRAEFLRAPENTLVALCDRGLELSRTEIAALVNTDRNLWARTADGIDPRLQKASFRNDSRAGAGAGH
jgi:hypothetical protein